MSVSDKPLRPSKPRRKMQTKQAKSGGTATAAAKSGLTRSEAFDYSGWGGGGRSADAITKFLPRCVHNVAHVIDLADVSIHLSDGWGARGAPAGSIVLNCTGSPKHDPPILPDSVRGLLAHCEEARVTEITLPWPDGGTPPVKPSFWRALLETCAREKAPLVIHCVGGHGRTGTALAAILLAYSIPYRDAVNFVREKHCVKAIETQSQLDYLEDLDALLNENFGVAG